LVAILDMLALSSGKVLRLGKLGRQLLNLRLALPQLGLKEGGVFGEIVDFRGLLIHVSIFLTFRYSRKPEVKHGFPPVSTASRHAGIKRVHGQNAKKTFCPRSAPDLRPLNADRDLEK
jgi:hypothetical protein